MEKKKPLLNHNKSCLDDLSLIPEVTRIPRGLLNLKGRWDAYTTRKLDAEAVYSTAFLKAIAKKEQWLENCVVSDLENSLSAVRLEAVTALAAIDRSEMDKKKAIASLQHVQHSGMAQDRAAHRIDQADANLGEATAALSRAGTIVAAGYSRASNAISYIRGRTLDRLEFYIRGVQRVRPDVSFSEITRNLFPDDPLTCHRALNPGDDILLSYAHRRE